MTVAEGLAHACPMGVLFLARRGTCVNPTKTTLKRKGCHDATIKKASMKGRDTKKYRWLSAMRSPYERVFAHRGF